MKNIAVLISGSGSNLQSLIDAKLPMKIQVVISDREDAYGLIRAKKAGIQAIFLSKKGLTRQQYSLKILEVLKQFSIDLVVLAGFLSILTEEFIGEYPMKIINIHPSLIPSFCGEGYYGSHVHQAVYNKAVKYTGATVHFVEVGVDTGPIIEQEIVRVEDCDCVSDIASKVLVIEHKILVKVVKAFVEDKLDVKQNRVWIRE